MESCAQAAAAKQEWQLRQIGVEFRARRRIAMRQSMVNLSGIVKQLKKERDRLEQQLSGLHAALAAFAGVYTNIAVPKPRRKISAQGRARIAAAQRARWAKVNGQKVIPIPKGTKPGKRTMSASARRKIAAAQRARWVRLRRRLHSTT
jgi:hypothetical protein